MDPTPRLAALAAALGLCAPPAVAQQFCVPDTAPDDLGAPRDPLRASLYPRGAASPGTTSLTRSGTVYAFEYAEGGQVRLRYELDVADPVVLGGQLRVREVVHDVYPATEAGLIRADAGGAVQGPGTYPVVLTGELQSGKRLVLVYEAGSGADVDEFRLSVEIVGKALRCRLWDSEGGAAPAAIGNQVGVSLGRVEGGASTVGDPVDLRVPHMVATPLAFFRTAAGGTAYATVQVDTSRSNASAFSRGGVPTASPKALSYRMRIRNWPSSAGALNAPVDETAWLLVSDAIEDAFPETTAEPAPYRDVLATRPLLQFLFNRLDTGGDLGGLWGDYAELFDQLEAWGMDQLSGYVQRFWSESQWCDTDPAIVGLEFEGANAPSADWFPARDPVEFSAMMGRAHERGYLLGLYTHYTPEPDEAGLAACAGVPPGCYAPHPDQEVVFGPNGVDPLNPIACGQIALTMESKAAIATADVADALADPAHPLDLPLLYTDVIGYQHPAGGVAVPLVDHDATDPTKAKTIGEVLARMRAYFRDLAAQIEGPHVSEGSVLPPTTGHELLHAGFTDGLLSSLNTGALQLAFELDGGVDPLAPENWYVVPDYALKSAMRLQANHGMGGYERFFALNGRHFEALHSLDDERLNRHRLYEITYGKVAQVDVTGRFDTCFEPRVDGRGVVKEYFLMQALQSAYLSSEVREIWYWDGGSFRTLDGMLANAASPNPLDDLRDARLVVLYENGLAIWLNHAAGGSWPIASSGVLPDGTPWNLPEDFDLDTDGWLAQQPVGGPPELLALRAWPASLGPFAPGRVVDYAEVPGRYRLFDGHGKVDSYRGYPRLRSGGRLAVDHLPSGRRLREDVRLGVCRGLSKEISIVEASPPSPSVAPLPAQVEVPAGLRVGDRGLARMRRHFVDTVTGEESSEELSYLRGAWSSSDPSVATVDRAGAVRAVGRGEAVLTFAHQGDGPILSVTSAPIDVAPAAPEVRVEPRSGAICAVAATPGLEVPRLVIDLYDAEGVADLGAPRITIGLPGICAPVPLGATTIDTLFVTEDVDAHTRRLTSVLDMDGLASMMGGDFELTVEVRDGAGEASRLVARNWTFPAGC